MTKFNINRFKNTNLYILLLNDIVIVLLSFYCAIFLRYEFIFPIEMQFSIQPEFVLSVLIIKVFCFKVFSLYRGMWRHTSIWDMISIIKANSIASLIFTIFIYNIYGFENYSRSVFILDLLLCTVLIGSSRVGIRLFFNNLIFPFHSDKNNNRKNVLLIGAGSTGDCILRESLTKKNSLINVIGFLDDNPNKLFARLHDVPVLGKIKEISNINIPYDEILICTPTASRAQIRAIVDLCKMSGKPFQTLPSISELIEGKVSISQFREVSLLDLLGREEVKLNKRSIIDFIRGKRVLVTGAGGSIGSELVRQCIKFDPSVLIMMDLSELNLFEIEREIMAEDSHILFKPILSDIRDYSVLDQVFKEFQPQIVFHAAAYKHVPMQEFFPWEAVKTNVFGTSNVSDISVKYSVEKFVLVSTDKAVKPVNVMGATKRLAEMIIQNYNRLNDDTEFMAVRFGNVLGSSGSVIPIFQEQIKNGGPVTITDPDMERYFMSIPEASQLILQAGSLGVGGEVFILDMGNPIKIIDIANDLIRLSGYEPELDIPIKFTGTRPGEKKIEELSLPNERLDKTKHDKIFVLNDPDITKETLSKVILDIKDLENGLSGRTANEVRSILSTILPEYQPDLASGEPIYLRIKSEAEA